MEGVDHLKIMEGGSFECLAYLSDGYGRKAVMSSLKYI